MLEPGSLLMMKGECRYVWKHGIPKAWGEWDSQGNWWPRTRRVSVTLRKVVERKVRCPGGVGCVGKGSVRGVPNNPNNPTCPYQHNPRKVEEEDPKQKRKAAQTHQHSDIENNNNPVHHPEAEGEEADRDTSTTKKLNKEPEGQGKAKPSYREALLKNKDKPKPKPIPTANHVPTPPAQSSRPALPS